MTIMINLLPDTRQAKLRERRRHQLVSGVSILVWVICGGVVALLALYAGGQQVVKSQYEKKITDKKAELTNTPGIIEALTAQEHLAALPGLYGKRVFMTKFFESYAQVNPGEVSLSSLTIDSQNAMIVNGTATTYATVAKLVRALEAANIKVGTGASESNSPYFTNVTITSIGSSSGRGGVAFTMNASLGSGVTDGQK